MFVSEYTESEEETAVEKYNRYAITPHAPKFLDRIRTFMFYQV